MSEPAELVPLYLDGDQTTVRIINGPHDGRTLVWGTQPPHRIELAVEEPLTLESLRELRPSFRRAAYEPALDDFGFPRRADDGALLYECRIA